MMRGSNVHYQVADRTRAVSCGGMGAVHAMVRKLGLVDEIDRHLKLLKVHLPYHESDHILNISLNIMAGHRKLEDLELLRQDESYLDLLGAQRIPDPTTEGDFLRRFAPSDVMTLMDLTNAVRVKVWRQLPQDQRRRAVIDADGTITPTDGEKKRGMNWTYKGIWGYHPLLVSLATTQEPLYIVNRPGNAVSHDGAAPWIDKAVALVRQAFDEVVVRGDTDFSLTKNFDRWTDDRVTFYFGYDARKNLVAEADSLPETAFRRLRRRVKVARQGPPRVKRENVKEEIVTANDWTNIRLDSEDVAEFAYRPTACHRTYRMIVLRKNLTRARGEQALFDETRYFFYVTNDFSCDAEQVIFEANDRCNQENLIEQLKGGIGAMRVPVHDLVSNWAYMVIASLAWTFKAWFALLQPRRADRASLLAMEYKRFLHAVILIPTQVIRGAHRLKLRLLAYRPCTRLIYHVMNAATPCRAP
jgi:hypothetical protein